LYTGTAETTVKTMKLCWFF